MVKAKLKPLLPSLREKKRYLGFKIITAKDIPFNSLSSSIIKSYRNLFGELGLAEAGLKVMKDRYNKQKGIIRLNNNHENRLKAALVLIQNVNGQDIIISSEIVSGTLKKAESQLRGG